MSNQVLRAILDIPRDKYNILTFPTHERYQEGLAKTGHNFYLFNQKGAKKWDETYAPHPPNQYSLPEDSLVMGIDFDFILSQSKFGQYQMSKRLQQTLRVPIVSLEHTLPLSHWPPEQLNAFRQMSGDINIFISEYSSGEWNIPPSQVIHHSVDNDLFCNNLHENREAVVLSVVNDFANRDYCCNYEGWKRITEGLPVRLVGNSPGLSEAASSTQALVSEYQKAQIFLNTSTVSPVPTSLLEAMSCGCAVVSTATCMIPSIIEHGVNGFISNDENELRSWIQTLFNNEDLRSKVGHAARETVIEKFSQETFITNWNKVFDAAKGMNK